MNLDPFLAGLLIGALGTGMMTFFATTIWLLLVIEPDDTRRRN